MPVELEATGSGVVYAVLSWSYNLADDGAAPAFNCSASQMPGGESEMEARFCCR